MRLTLACGDYDRVRALTDGRVRAEGLDLIMIHLGPEEMFFRQLVHHEFDASEVSLSSYVAGISRGDSSLVAIPVFPSRSFRHSAIFVNADAGIARPEDLKGKRIGAAEYQQTALVWIRGILLDEYGIAPTDMEWITGGLEEPGRREKVPLGIGARISMRTAPRDATLSDLLERGEIDALFTPRLPSSFLRGAPSVKRLFPNYRQVEAEYYRRTGIFPIMHTLAIRREIYEKHRWLAQSLVKAFEEAKELAMRWLYETAALPVMAPWVHEEVETVQQAIAGQRDWWPYGLDRNRDVLSTFLRYASEQGITRSHLTIEDVFATEALETYRI